jgi:RNA polymerase sigma factor (TIGR02999 family)
VGGDRASADALFEVVYGELRKLADGVMRAERKDHTLQPTALVHEAFLRLVDVEELEVRGREQFFSLAARAMRRVLVDHARGREREKRGGGRERIALEGEGEPCALQGGDLDMLDVHDALERLAGQSERQARLVELRLFGGLPIAAIARMLDVSEATAERDWRAARAWLGHELTKGPG